MSHVDQGALHAYLDGALDEYPAADARRVREHLEHCAECAERLEEERRIRQAASAILGRAAPDVEVPGFEELKAYVKATRATAGRPALRLYRLGWAASVILALGVGWMARGGLRDQAMAPGFNEVGVPSESTDEAAGRTSSVTAGAREAGPARASGDAMDGVTASEVVASRRQLEEETSGRGVADERDQLLKVDEERAVVSEVAAIEDHVVTAENVANDADVLRTVVPAEAPEALVAAGARGNVDDTLAERGELPRTGGVGGLAATLPREELRVRADSMAVTDPSIPASAAAAREADPARRRAAEAVTTRIDAGAAVAPSVVADFAQAPAAPADVDDLGALAVPGVDVLSYANLEEGTTPKGVHVVQVFENGDILDVYHLPEGVELSVLPPLETGRNEERAQREGGWIVLRASRSIETLRELLARLAPEG